MLRPTAERQFSNCPVELHSIASRDTLWRSTFHWHTLFGSVRPSQIPNLEISKHPHYGSYHTNDEIPIGRELKQLLTYQQLLDELKRQFALDYLGNHSLSIKEIAYLLDYADASSFIRSFKRWEGKSPEQYRLTKV